MLFYIYITKDKVYEFSRIVFKNKDKLKRKAQIAGKGYILKWGSLNKYIILFDFKRNFPMKL